MRFGCCLKSSICSIGSSDSLRQPHGRFSFEPNRSVPFFVISLRSSLARLSSNRRRLPAAIRRKLR